MKKKLNYRDYLIRPDFLRLVRNAGFSLLLALVTISFVFAQNVKNVHGVVTDKSGNPLPGASVMVKGTANGTTSDQEGKYSLINIPQNAILIFSFVGMTSQEVPVGSTPVLDVMLTEDNVGLQEVVAIGYGTQTKKEVSGSIANLTKEDFNKGVMNSAADLLKGKVAGLQITQAGGDVTKTSVLRLRGTTSLSASSDPLVVIDGIPGLSLDVVAPEDIESISVLKDASASAIYGSRGANGVIMITTRKGSASKTQIQYDAFVGIETPAHIPRMLNATEYRDYVKAAGITNFEDNGGNTDWYKAISRTAVSHEHNATLSGGSEKNNYIATINYQNRQGVILNSKSERLNGRFSFTQRAINNRLKITLTGISTMKDWTPIEYDAFILAKNVKPTEPIYNSDGTYWEPYEYDYGNPVSILKLNKHDHESNYNLGNAIFEFNILDGLKYSLNVSRAVEKETTGDYINSTTRSGTSDNGRATREAYSNKTNILETNLSYDKRWKLHNIKLLAGYSYEDKYWDHFGAQNRDFLFDDFTYNNLGAGNDLRPTDVWSGKSMYKLISFYARAQYDFSGKYFLTATLRRDGSSKFGANNKWGYFPSASVAWRLSDEDFMKNVHWINDMKIRVGYGSSGNQGIDPYKSLATYGATGKFIDNGQIISGYQPNQNPNPNLRWETTTQFNIGLDYSLFTNRVFGSVEYYRKNTKDLLYTYPVSVPPFLYNNITANVGKMLNEGIEGVITVDVIRHTDFKWSTSLNVAHNRNEVLSLSNDQFQRDYVTLESEYVRGINNIRHILEPGHPVGTFFGLKFKGFDADGKWIFEDINKDGQITEGYGNDYTYNGSAFPNITGGFLNTFNYKNVDLSVFFQGMAGNKILNLARIAYENIQNVPQGNIYASALDIPLDDVPIVSSYYVEDGSFLRLEYMTLGYTFKPRNINWLNKLRMYFTGQNLFILTKYKGTDPEVPMDGQTPGMESRGFYPKARTFTFGINVTF